MCSIEKMQKTPTRAKCTCLPGLIGSALGAVTLVAWMIFYYIFAVSGTELAKDSANVAFGFAMFGAMAGGLIVVAFVYLGRRTESSPEARAALKEASAIHMGNVADATPAQRRNARNLLGLPALPEAVETSA